MYGQSASHTGFLSSTKLSWLSRLAYNGGCLCICAALLRVALRSYCAAHKPIIASKGQRYVALTLSTILILGYSWDILFRQEHWPFSNTPMFGSWRWSNPLKYSAPGIYGVPASNPQLEFALTENRFYSPFHSSKEFCAIVKVAERKHHSQDSGRVEALRWLAHRYQQTRRSDPQANPELIKLRWYDRQWLVDKLKVPSAVNLQQTLMTEVNVDAR